MNENELKKITILQEGMDISNGDSVVANEQVDAVKEKIKSPRARLMELFAEQKNWQNQLREIGGGLTFDDVHNKIKQANEKIRKHQKIIEKCEECEKKQGKKVSIMVPIEVANNEYTIAKVIYDGSEPIDEYYVYSIEHSLNRIAFWENEIANFEQKLKMMEIAQQQLEQIDKEIEDVNDKIRNATLRLTSGTSVEETSNKIEMASIPENNIETTKLYRTDCLLLEICQKNFDEIITTSKSKQEVIRRIRDTPTHFNPNCFTHKELANELNNLQRKFNFTKLDVDHAYKSKNSNIK